MAAPTNRLVIGLDFGTTFTGVGFQVVSQAAEGEFNLVRDWPGGAITDKVPSEYSYSPAPEGTSQWGGHFSSGSTKLVWTKLQLDEQKRTEELSMILDALIGTNNLDFEIIRQSRGLPSYPAKDPVEVVADYLEKVRQVLWANLLQTFGPVVLQTIPVDLVFTVPAMWSEGAKNRTLCAITKAGFDEIHFRGLRKIAMVSEPEATAVSILKDLRPRFGDQGILPGDSFVLCDAGGGTVDLISYRVRQVSPELEMEKATYGTGDKCGATFIDRRFRLWLKRKLGPADFDRLTETGAQDRIGSHTIVEALMVGIMRDFEVIKKRFEGIGKVGDEHLTLPHPLDDLTDRENGIRDGEIRITEHDLQEMFQPSVTRTIELIAGQIASVELAGSRAKYVFLSGGFATSPYLYSEVHEYLYMRGIRLERPAEHIWSSVVRGAVECGVKEDNRMINLSLCPRHWGLSVSQPFSPFMHSQRDAYNDPFDGQKKAKDQMVWLIKKGDAIMSDQPTVASTNICRKFGRRDPRVFKTLLVSSADKNTQQRFADVPRATRSIADITYDFTEFPETQLTSVKGPGGPYFLVDFKIELQLTATRVTVSVSCNGLEMKRIAVNY